MDPALLRTFSDLAYRKAGICLTADKATMVTARLGRRLRALGLQSEEQYRDLLYGRGGERELVHFLDAISTNHTYFFREQAHFEHISREAARWLREGRRRLRFWSAGTASGEEAYTLAMVLEEAFAGADVDYRILATDISTHVLAVAREGVYGEAQAARIPRPLRERYFARAYGAEGKITYRAIPALRDRIVIARLNLARPPFPMTGPIDAVLCRNVMLYFDVPVRQALIGEIERVLAPGGLLFIGHTESLRGVATRLHPVCPSVYASRLPGALPGDPRKEGRVTPVEAARLGRAVRVLVVDDSALVRREIRRLLSRDPDIEVIGEAADAYEARDLVLETQPDVMTLDLEMPRMDGLTFLGKLGRYRPVPVVVVSAMTARGGHLAMEAIEAGATEVVPKPGPGYSPAQMAQDLVHAVKAAARASHRGRPARPTLAPGAARLPSAPAPARGVIAIGASTGGPQAIEGLLHAMPLDAPAMVVVQHMPPVFTRSFAQRLAAATSFDVREAADGDALAPGRVLIAPGGRQMRVRALSGARSVEVREGERVNHHCPSVDVLFASVAHAVGRSAVGVLLTGMGNDGAAGLLEMKQAGAITLAQGEAGCVVFGMPRAAADLGAADELVALEHLPRRILAAVSRR